MTNEQVTVLQALKSQDDAELFRIRQAHDDAFQQIYNKCVESDGLCKRLAEQVKDLQIQLRVQENERREWKLKEGQGINSSLDSPLVIALIDGDGCIFSKEYLKEGEAGGRKAAAQLTSGIMNYLRSAPEAPPSGIKIWVMLFLSKSGLATTLERHNICNTDVFSEFLSGFNQAHGLFAVVDCGNAKEAADYKMRDHLEAVIRGPQVYRIFFGGSHDNGYSGSISSLKTLGYGDKLVILQSYQEIATEIAKLQLPNKACEIDGLFMKEKLDYHHTHRRSNTTLSQDSATPKSPNPNGKVSYSAIVSSPASEVSLPSPKITNATPIKGSKGETQSEGRRRLNPNIPLSKQNPPPCFAQYLTSAGKCNAAGCQYGHNYEMTPRDKQRLMAMAANIPCRNEADDNPCYRSDCFMGHYCPNGPECLYRKQNRCKFTGEYAHDA